VSADITDLYKQAATALGVAYSATVPDTDLIYSVIKGKLEAFYNARNDAIIRKQDYSQLQAPGIFSREEITMQEKPKATISVSHKLGGY
jgi:hypothetical protein